MLSTTKTKRRDNANSELLPCHVPCGNKLHAHIFVGCGIGHRLNALDGN
jgi:hypothetical protein